MKDLIETLPPTRQRSARNDSDMRDGDSGHGNPYESAGDEVVLDSDRDLEDLVGDDELTPSGPDAVTSVSPGQLTDAEMAIPDYDQLTVTEILEWMPNLSREELNQISFYERGHRNRKTLVKQLARRMQQ